MKIKHKKLCTTLAGALFLISSGAAYADKGQPPSETPPTQPADQQQTINQLLLRIEALEKKLGTMETKPPAEERLAKIEGKIEQVREESSAANIDNNFALAGYGIVSLMKERGDGGTGDKTSLTANFNPIFLYSYQDKFLFTGELELGLSSDGETEAELEQAHLTYNLGEHTLINAGRFLLPFGTFSERLHPAWINKLGMNTPINYNKGAGIFSGALRNNGLQFRGHIPLGEVSKGTFQAFTTSGPTYVAVGSDERLRFGSSVDLSSPTVGGRLGFLPIPNAEIGLSYMGGKIQRATDNANRRYRAASLDAEYHLRGFEVRGEYVDLAHDLDNGESVKSRGLYAQLSSPLTILNASLSKFEGVLRYGRVRRDKRLGDFQNVKETSFGINYYHAPFIKSALSFSNYSVNELDRIDLSTSFAF